MTTMMMILMIAINYCGDDGIDQGGDKNALYIASDLGHSDYVKVIISYEDIKVNKRNTYFGKTALYIAAEKNQIKVVQVLTIHSEVDVNNGRSSDGSTAFSITSEKGYSEIMKELILHDEIDVNLGWSQSSWTFQTRNNIMRETGQATKTPNFSTTTTTTVDGGGTQLDLYRVSNSLNLPCTTFINC